MPIRHGLTMGELARLFNGESKIGADLTVVAVEGWRRDDWFDDTGAALDQPVAEHAQSDAGDALSRHRRVREHERVGRPRHGHAVRAGRRAVDRRRAAGRRRSTRGEIPGVRFYPVRFTPTASKYANEECQGVFIVVTNRAALRPVRLGVEIAAALHEDVPGGIRAGWPERLFGSRDGIARIRAGEDPAAIAASWGAAESRWRLLRAPYLLYR